MKSTLLILTIVLFGISTAHAEPALIETFDATSTCINADGDFVIGNNERHIVITNNGKGRVNMTIKGVCPSTSKKAVKFDSDTFPIVIGCNAGSAGTVFHWTYHMRPDGRYTTKCSSHPMGN